MPDPIEVLPSAPTTPGEVPLLPPAPAELNAAIQAAQAGTGPAFETALPTQPPNATHAQMTEYLGKLNTVARYILNWEARRVGGENVRLNSECQNVLRTRLEAAQARIREIAGLEYDVRQQLLSLRGNVELQQLSRRNAIANAPRAIANAGTQLGSAALTGLRSLEAMPGIGPMFREIRYFFGNSVPEASETVGHWIQKGFWHLVASPSLLGLDTSNIPFLSNITRVGQDHLARLATRDALKEFADTSGASFEGGIPDNLWRQWRQQIPAAAPAPVAPAAPVAPGATPVAAPVAPAAALPALTDREGIATYWQRKAQEYTQAKATETTWGTPANPKRFTFANLLAFNPTVMQRQAAEAQARTRLDAIKSKLPNPGTVTLTAGNAFSFRRTGANIAATVPLTGDHFDAAGTATSPDAQLFVAALTNMPAAQEVVIGTETRLERLTNGIKVTLRTGTNTGELANINAVCAPFLTRTRIGILSLDVTLPTLTPGVKIAVMNGIVALQYNSQMSYDQLATFLVQQEALINGASIGQEIRFMTGSWRNFPL